jgi:hypothetical protein
MWVKYAALAAIVNFVSAALLVFLLSQGRRDRLG